MAARMDVLETKDPSETTTAQQSTVPVCELCLCQPSRYKCPQCRVSYCSLSCYRGGKHSGCSEKFYKNQFMEVMKEKKGSEDDRRRMQEILQRVDAEYRPLFDEEGEEIDKEEEEGGETEKSLEERIAGLDLDKDIDRVWEQLTTKEKMDFEKVLEAGKLGSLVTVWKPWWEQHDQELVRVVGFQPAEPSQPPRPEEPKKPSYADEIEEDLERMAQDLGLDARGEEEVVAEEGLATSSGLPPCPEVLKDIPKLDDLLRSKKPSECMAYNLLNVLYSYAYAVRLYNGAHGDLPVQVAQNILELSSTLSDGANFLHSEDSLSVAIHNASKSLFTSNTFSTSILRDVSHLLLGGSSDAPIGYINAALSDLHRLFATARKQLSKESKQIAGSAAGTESTSSRGSTTGLQRTCFNCQKKLDFYLAWMAGNKDRPRLILPEVEAMFRSRQLMDEQHNATKSALEKKWGGPKPPAKAPNRLIEELS